MVTATDLAILQRDYFSALDKQFARFICGDSEQPTELYLGAALASYFRSLGHSCVHLPALAETPIPTRQDFLPTTELRLAAAKSWPDRLRLHRDHVGAPGDVVPLILDDQDRLYLYRYWQYEEFLAQQIRSRCHLISPQPSVELFRVSVNRYCPDSLHGELERERMALAVAASRQFSVISGGPGSGKTTLVAKILAVALETSPHRQSRIALAAPTGKAAMRLQEAVQSAVRSLPIPPAIVSAMPTTATTLHRLLGYVPNSAKYRFDAKNPLPCDLVVVDEASMVDLTLMARLFKALHPDCRVILVGDKDQLASVQPGSVLHDVCAVGMDAGTDHALTDWLRQVGIASSITGVNGIAVTSGIVELRTNYRFSSTSGIHALATAVQRGDDRASWELLSDPSSVGRDIAFMPLPEASDREHPPRELSLEAYRDYLQSAVPEEIYDRFARARFLCALRHGPLGADTFNLSIRRQLADCGVIDWDYVTSNYHGQPIIVLRNDYGVELFNGDVGLILRSARKGVLCAYFPAPGGGLREIALARLPAYATCYAMTVHKSQGSEFDWVCMVLPEHDSRVVTRELLYTGITRARKRFCLVGSEAIFRHAVREHTIRYSGLRSRFAGTG